MIWLVIVCGLAFYFPISAVAQTAVTLAIEPSPSFTVGEGVTVTAKGTALEMDDDGRIERHLKGVDPSKSSIAEPSIAELRSKQHIFSLTPYPPYFVAKDVEVVEGIAGHSIQLILANAQLDVVFRVVNYGGAKQAMKEGKFAFANWGDDSETRDEFYSPLPEVDLGLAVYASAGTDIVPKDIGEFAGKELIVVEGWPLMDYERLIYGKSRAPFILSVSSVKRAISLLKDGRGDHVIVLQDPVEQLQSSLTQGMRFRVLQTIKGYFLVIPKRYPGSKRLKVMIEDSYHDLIKRKIISPLETYKTKKPSMMVEVVD